MESRCPEVGAPSGASVASRAPVAALRLWPQACRFKTAGILFPHYLVSVSEVGPACGSWISRERLTAQSECHGRIRSSRLCGRQECLPTARDLLSQDSFADFWRHGSREEQCLVSLRHQFADALDIGDEAHVEHTVRFINHENFDARHH